MVGRNTGIRILDVILKNKIQQEMIISDIKYTPLWKFQGSHQILMCISSSKMQFMSCLFDNRFGTDSTVKNIPQKNQWHSGQVAIKITNT
jgi:hypothetical protein